MYVLYATSSSFTLIQDKQEKEEEHKEPKEEPDAAKLKEEKEKKEEKKCSGVLFEVGDPELAEGWSVG